MGKEPPAQITADPAIRENEPTAFRKKKASQPSAPEEDELCPQQLPQPLGDRLQFKLEPNWCARAKPTGYSLLRQRRCQRPRQELPATTRQLQTTTKIKVLIYFSFWGSRLSSTKAFEHPNACRSQPGHGVPSPPISCHLSGAQEPFAQGCKDRKPCTRAP